MSTATQTLQKHYARILRLWPTDPLRQVTFHAAFKRRLSARILGVPSLKTNAPGAAATSAAALELPPRLDPQLETAQVNALYSLLDNRYAKQYPVSEKLLEPQFKPSYYQDLAREMDEAPRRSWLNNKLMRWSRLVRLS